MIGQYTPNYQYRMIQLLYHSEFVLTYPYPTMLSYHHPLSHTLLYMRVCLHENAFITDIFEQQCCQIDCYTLKDCKQATSPHCSNAKVECAMGKYIRSMSEEQPLFYHKVVQ